MKPHQNGTSNLHETTSCCENTIESKLKAILKQGRHVKNRKAIMKQNFLGKQASVAKYDVLAALGSFAMSKDKHTQKLVLRLITLITTRYNWRADELKCGQEQIARLWHVDVRTVKRDLMKLRAMDWLEVKIPAARGRVASYRINFEKILCDTKTEWEAMGSDFADRLASYQDTPKIVPLNATPQQAVPVADGSFNATIHHALYEIAPKHYAAWFRQLQFQEREARVGVIGPSAFHIRYVETHYADIVRAAISNNTKTSSPMIVYMG